MTTAVNVLFFLPQGVVLENYKGGLANFFTILFQNQIHNQSVLPQRVVVESDNISHEFSKKACIKLLLLCTNYNDT